MANTADRLLLASVHDVSPRFESEVDRLLDLLRLHVGCRVALLAVPNHWGDAPIVPGSAFASRLRGWSDEGMEVFLHGFFHRDCAEHENVRARARARLLTAGEGEFLGLGRDDAAARIADGRALVESIIGKPVAGFVAPAWLYGAGALEALADCGIRLAEDHFRVWSPATGRLLPRGPVITWASRTRPRLLSSLAAAAALRRVPMPVLRIGVHPPDIHHPRLVDSIERTFAAAAHRRPASYAELLAA